MQQLNPYIPNISLKDIGWSASNSELGSEEPAEAADKKHNVMLEPDISSCSILEVIWVKTAEWHCP